MRATSTGVAEATFDLTFQVNAAGTVQFLVMYAKVYARFMDTYVVFDNAVSAHTSVCWLLGCGDARLDGFTSILPPVWYHVWP